MCSAANSAPGSGADSPVVTPGAAGYVNYVTPGILLMTVAAAVQGTAIVVAMDMTGGIIDRFRTMAIARACVLTGHVLASLIQTLISVLVVLGVAVAVGFRPTADAASWLAAVGVLTLFALALIWLATALGLAAKSVETASNTPMFLTLLPFLGSGFVPTASMPAGLRQFATYQPFTPVTETLRGLLTGTHIGANAMAQSPGASASPSPPTSGPGTSTTDATPADPAEGKQVRSGRSAAVGSRAGRLCRRKAVHWAAGPRARTASGR